MFGRILVNVDKLVIIWLFSLLDDIKYIYFGIVVGCMNLIGSIMSVIENYNLYENIFLFLEELLKLEDS